MSEKDKNKNQQKMDFMTYLGKTKKEREERRKKGKDMSGLGGTPIRKSSKIDSIVEHDEVNPSIAAIEYAKIFKKANEEEKQKDEGEERE